MTGKLTDYHVSLGTFGAAEAVAEQKSVCTLLGLLDQRQQHLVSSVAERLPLANRDSDGVDTKERKEEEDLIVTPVPSSSARQSHPSARSDRTTTTAASKRKRASSSQRVTEKHF